MQLALFNKLKGCSFFVLLTHALFESNKTVNKFVTILNDMYQVYRYTKQTKMAARNKTLVNRVLTGEEADCEGRGTVECPPRAFITAKGGKAGRC